MFHFIFLGVFIFFAVIYPLYSNITHINNNQFYESYENRNPYSQPEKRNKLMNICGLPDGYTPTSHCFADGTHQTCCMLGPEARKYADESGNPIGSAAKKAFKEYMGRDPNNDELTPWCTCFGSEVCSFYSKKFNDGTHIRFVNNPQSSTDIRKDVSPNCEGYFRKKFSIIGHRTPGITNNVNKAGDGDENNTNDICENNNYSKLEKLKLN